MKKLFKLAVSLFVCGLILLSGCGTPSTSLPSELIGQASGYPETLNIISKEFFWYSDDQNAETAKLLWMDEMSRRYGVQINVISNSYTEDGTFKSAFSGVDKETFSGLSQAEDITYLQDMIQAGLAVPLDEYLADNAVWNALPEGFRETFKVNGHIYAIPAYVRDYMNTRIIHKDLFEQIGINVTDLDSLKEFAAAYSKATGKSAIDFNNNNNIIDILNAFGLYNGSDGYAPISYDPTEDCYEDFLTKGAAVQALEYLRELYAAGGLNLCDDFHDIPKNFADHITASVIAEIGDYNPDDYSEVLTLNPQYPRILNSQVFGFYMLKNTAQPKETINLFVNMMYGSEQNYLDCWLGGSANYILNSDGTITVNMVQNSDGSYTVPAMPNLVGGFSGVFPYSDSKLLYSQDGVVTEDSKTEAGKQNAIYKNLSDAFEKGTVIKVPLSYSMINCPTYYSNYGTISDLYQTCLEDAITATDWTVQQVIDDYKEQMLNLGGNAMLDEMNAAIGKKTAYYYG